MSIETIRKGCELVANRSLANTECQTADLVLTDANEAVGTLANLLDKTLEQLEGVIDRFNDALACLQSGIQTDLRNHQHAPDLSYVMANDEANPVESVESMPTKPTVLVKAQDVRIIKTDGKLQVQYRGRDRWINSPPKSDAQQIINECHDRGLLNFSCDRNALAVHVNRLLPYLYRHGACSLCSRTSGHDGDCRVLAVLHALEGK